MTSIQPELWVSRVGEAVDFYRRAFDAQVVHRVGDGDDGVAQLAIGGAAFWVSTADERTGRFSPDAISGGTGRVLLVVDDPDGVVGSAVAAGAVLLAPAGEEHGWRLGRITDPFGHEWEIGRPTGPWPPHEG